MAVFKYYPQKKGGDVSLLKSFKTNQTICKWAVCSVNIHLTVLQFNKINKIGNACSLQHSASTTSFTVVLLTIGSIT